MQLRSLYLPLAALFCAASLFGQGATLSGTVRDPQGTPVAGAEISLFDRLSGNTRKTLSGPGGEYQIPGLADGRYRLEAQASATALTAAVDFEVRGDTTQDVTLELARAAVRVLVTATSTPISDREVARSVDVIDIQQVNERVEYSLAEALRALPGLQVQTQAGGITQIRTRGLRNQDTAILIDGLRFRDAAAPQGDASGFVSDMNITDLGRVEFLRGSGSSLYGTNAIAGTVNLNSNEGGGPLRGALRAEGGGLGMARSTLNLAGGLRSDRFVYSGGASHLNVTGGVRGKTPNRNNSGQLYGKYNFTPATSLSGRVWGARVFQRSVDSPAFTPAILANFPAAPGVVKAIPLADSQLKLYENKQPFAAGNATFIPGVPDPDGSRQSSFAAAAFILRQQVSATTSWRASYQLVDTRRAMYDGPAGAGSFEPRQSQLSNANGRTDQWQLRLDSLLPGWLGQFTGGYELEREAFDSLASRNLIGGARIRTTANQLSHSFYGQNQVSLLNNRLQIVFGGRVQTFDLRKPTFTGATSPYETVRLTSPETAITGDISVAYLAPTNTKFRAHTGNGYRAPSLFERFGSGYSSFSSSFTYYGDPRLKPEKSRSIDAGLEQWLFRDRVRTSATWFYTDLSETIIFDSANFPAAGDPFGRFFGYRNSFGGGISRGVELSTQLAPTAKTTITAAYTFVNSEQRTPTIGRTFFEALRTARNLFTLTATQWVTRRFHLSFDYYAIGGQYESPFGANGRILKFPGPKKADLVGNYRIPLGDSRSVDIYGKIENLTNRRYTDNGFLAPQIWGIAGMKYNF
jgi:iron complex outermembrane receptor protein